MIIAKAKTICIRRATPNTHDSLTGFCTAAAGASNTFCANRASSNAGGTIVGHNDFKGHTQRQMNSTHGTRSRGSVETMKSTNGQSRIIVLWRIVKLKLRAWSVRCTISTQRMLNKCFKS